MYKFKIIKDYYEKDEFLYEKDTIIFKEGLTVLVGCNGSGKTTLFNQIERILRDDETVFLMKYDNLHQGGSNKIGELAFRNNIKEAALRVMSSEGENIYYNIGEIISKLGTAIKGSKINKKKIFLLLDAVDSGLSIDYCSELSEIINDLIIPDAKQSNVKLYIIASTNAYELARNNECFDIQHGKYIKFKDYEEYRDFILKSKEFKDIKNRKEVLLNERYNNW